MTVTYLHLACTITTVQEADTAAIRLVAAEPPDQPVSYYKTLRKSE